MISMNKCALLFLILCSHESFSTSVDDLDLISDSSFQENVEDMDDEGRVIGGSPAQEGQFPFTAALYNNGKFTCTASIISNTDILTAAHCVVDRAGRTMAYQLFTARIGSVNRESSAARTIKFSQLIVHPQYNSRNFKNDIAVFKTTEYINFTNTTQRTCLARSDTGLDEYKNATVMGWGMTNRLNYLYYPDILQYNETKILPHVTCMARYNPGTITLQMICADGFGTGICHGDSGGPMTYVSPDKVVELGIASFGRMGDCGTYGTSPAVFTRVSSYIDWLRSFNIDFCTL